MVHHFSSGKAPVCEVHHSPPCNAKVIELMPLLPHMPLWCVQGYLYFTLLLLYPITYFVVIQEYIAVSGIEFT